MFLLLLLFYFFSTPYNLKTASKDRKRRRLRDFFQYYKAFLVTDKSAELTHLSYSDMELMTFCVINYGPMAYEVTGSDPSHSLPFMKNVFWTKLNKSLADVFIELLMAYSDLCDRISLFLSLTRIGIPEVVL